MRIKYLLLIFLLNYHFAFSQNEELLKLNIDKLLSDNFFETTLAAVDIYDLTAQQILYQKNNKMLLHPASNMKILTTAAALLFLGPDYKFQTKLYYTGEIVNQTLYGDLYIKGGCDPDFTSQDIDSLVYAINSVGIKEISGNIYGDVSMIDSLFWGSGWMWDDDPSTDEPYLTALNINDNAISVLAERTNPGKLIKVSILPETKYVQIDNKAISVDSGISNTLKVTRDWLYRKNTIIIKGALNREKELNRVNVFKPELYFLTLFQESLNKLGIKSEGEKSFSSVPSFAVPLYTFERTFDSVIVNLNKTSDNLSAEMTLRALGAKYNKLPSTAEDGIKMIDSMIVLAGLDPTVYRLVDGSGVSHYNLISAELLIGILKYFYYQHPELYEILYNSFPAAGVDGTLRNRMKNTKAEKNVHAKTGTLSGVSCLSGYVTAANGNQIAFSILIQNHVRNTAAAVAFQNEVCRLLAEYR